MGQLMKNDFAKSVGIKSGFENPMAQVVRFWAKIRRLDPSDDLLEKMASVFCQVKSSGPEPVQQQYEVHTKVRARVRSMRWNTNTTTMSERSRRASSQPD